ncbi:hypothetical protein CSTERLE_09990 [Thermoclostridium stercorarium subsp. leptospartum DSM 9219]|uniref:Uncharacterized protein n=1 Tax=Thermoclostridium stercorarium subsp. leptospartum DSM 9219 TaxID=1346611 RepID=A0A1B1YM78_THEST|nr:hypothetical protein CSTERLE_09990 [Thermoclostridium stercorarium subsp. leptospartum DSM 9219]
MRKFRFAWDFIHTCLQSNQENHIKTVKRAVIGFELTGFISNNDIRKICGQQNKKNKTPPFRSTVSRNCGVRET